MNSRQQKGQTEAEKAKYETGSIHILHLASLRLKDKMYNKTFILFTSPFKDR